MEDGEYSMVDRVTAAYWWNGLQFMAELDDCDFDALCRTVEDNTGLERGSYTVHLVWGNSKSLAEVRATRDLEVSLPYCARQGRDGTRVLHFHVTSNASDASAVEEDTNEDIVDVEQSAQELSDALSRTEYIAPGPGGQEQDDAGERSWRSGAPENDAAPASPQRDPALPDELSDQDQPAAVPNVDGLNLDSPVRSESERAPAASSDHFHFDRELQDDGSYMKMTDLLGREYEPLSRATAAGKVLVDTYALSLGVKIPNSRELALRYLGPYVRALVSSIAENRDVPQPVLPHRGAFENSATSAEDGSGQSNQDIPHSNTNSAILSRENSSEGSTSAGSLPSSSASSWVQLPVQRAPVRRRPPANPILHARFVADENYPDGSPMVPLTRFIKIWRVRNSGNVPWPARTKLVCIGPDMSMCNEVKLTNVLRTEPQEVARLQFPLQAPREPGRYKLVFRLRTDDGRCFGNRFWVDIIVQALPPPRRGPLPAYSAEIQNLRALGVSHTDDILRRMLHIHKGSCNAVADVLFGR